MAARFYYPAFYQHGRRLYKFMQRWQKDMVQINGITAPELTELNALYSDLDQIFGKASTWPKYSEGR